MRFSLILLVCLLIVSHVSGAASVCASERGVPILLYHRFGPTVVDSMTVGTEVFESHLKTLHQYGYKVIDVGPVEGVEGDGLFRLPVPHLLAPQFQEGTGKAAAGRV